MLRFRVMSWRLIFALALIAGFATAGHATVWQRKRADGTLEYTNVAPPSGGTWSALKEASHLRAAAARRPVAAVAPAPRPWASSAPGGGIVWARDHDDGTVEFTNVTPVGARWKDK